MRIRTSARKWRPSQTSMFRPRFITGRPHRLLPPCATPGGAAWTRPLRRTLSSGDDRIAWKEGSKAPGARKAPGGSAARLGPEMSAGDRLAADGGEQLE